MTCDEVRELLPEHLFGALDGSEDLEVRRHLRGCAACRAERAKLEEGVVALSRAAHDHDPPADLRGRVLGTLEEDWDEAPGAPPHAASDGPTSRERRPRWLAVAAAISVLIAGGSLGWGVWESHRATLAAADAASYQQLLHAFGGKDFRFGTLKGSGGDLTGQVLVYDGDEDRSKSSWGFVLAHDAGVTGAATATLLTPDGETRALPSLHFSAEGDASTWLVTGEDLASFDRLTITTADGTVVGSATIHPA